MELGARSKVGSEVLRPKRLAPGARSHPGSPRARLRADARVAQRNAVQDDDAQQQQEEATFVPILAKRGGPDCAGSSRFKGVTWAKISNKWKAQCEGKSLGYHITEEAAARAYSKYLKDGIDPVKHRPATNTSQFAGVCWDKAKLKWRAECKGTKLGCHATEEDAVRAYREYLEDGIDPVEHRGAGNSQFTGVSWSTSKNKWKAQCMREYLGIHATETAAAQAYNLEAARVGLTLNIIPPAGAADADGAGAGGRAGAGTRTKRAGAGTACKRAGGSAGPKRAAPKTSAAPAPSKKMKS